MPDARTHTYQLAAGVIDAAVNGGVMRYEQAFLNDQYAEEHPDHADKVDLLRSVLEQQVAVLDRGLEVHQMVVPPEMADLQNQLQSAYTTTHTTHHTPHTIHHTRADRLGYCSRVDEAQEKKPKPKGRR